MRNIKNTPKNKIAGIALMSNSTVPKHKIKSKSNVPTSDIRHLTSNTAITLIALVITIIVLLILASVTLNMVIGQNGIFSKANTAKEETKKSQALEDVRTKVLEAELEAQTEEQRQADLGDVVLKLEQATDTYKITKISKIAKLDSGSTTTANEAKNLDEIYVTNLKYEYEVKVDRMLQTSITGEAEKGEETNKTYTITFNANGGNIEKTSKQIAYNEEYGELEIPTKTGYNFNGWYTEKEGGTKIVSNMKYTLKENQELYAHWTEKTYVSDGLVLRYDGINNTGNGHSGTATTWKDLSGNGNDGILSGGTWEDNCLVFDGIDDWVNCGRQDYSNVTCEVVVFCHTDSYSLIMGNCQLGGYSIEVQGEKRFEIAGYKDGEGYIKCVSENLVKLNKLYSLSGSFGNNEVSLYENGIKYYLNEGGIIGLPLDKTICALGTNPAGDKADGDYFSGRIYSVRLYNRALTDEEVKNNYEIDKVKFGIE